MVNEETQSSEKPTKSIVFVALLWTLQSVGRFVFGYLSATTPGGLLDVEVAPVIIQIINTMFFLLGIFGFIAVVGLLLMRKWGILGYSPCQHLNNNLRHMGCNDPIYSCYGIRGTSYITLDAYC